MTTISDDDDLRRRLQEDITLRLIGTLDTSDSESIIRYVEERAKTEEDIASFNARLFTLNIVKRPAQHAAGAHMYLAERKEKGDSLADSAKALGLLSKEFTKHAPLVYEKAWAEDRPMRRDILKGLLPGPNLDVETLPDNTVRMTFQIESIIPTRAVEAVEENGMLRPDARLAAHLEGIGPSGKALAERIQEKASKRWTEYQASPKGEPAIAIWRFWLDTERVRYPRWVAFLLDVLWLDVVRPSLERESNKPTALVYPVHEDLTRVHSSTFKTVEKNGQRLLEFTDAAIKLERIDPLDVPACEMEVINKLLDKGLNRMGSIAGHKLLRWEVMQGHMQVLSGKQDPRKLDIEGGWFGLAELLGLDPDKWRIALHEIVVAQAHCAFRFPGGGYGNLLSYTVWPARGRRRGSVTIILGDPLLPHFVFDLKRTMSGRALADAQRLVPVIDIPPPVGSPNQHGPQATMSMAIVATMRAQAADMATHGGALLAFEDLATRSKIKHDNVPGIIDRWTQDGDDGPAFLKKVGSFRFTLGDTHKAARDFIVKAGLDSLAASSNGQASVRKRERSRK